MNSYQREALKRHTAIVKKFAPLIEQELKKQIKAFLAHDYEYAKRHIDKIVSPDGIARVIKSLYRTAAHLEANYQLSSLIKRYGRGPEQKRLPKTSTGASFGIGFDSLAPVVDSYFKIYMLNKSAIPISMTTKKFIRDHLVDKINGGMPYEQAVREFRELALTGGPNQSSRSRSRALGIAGTEATGALSFGGMIGAYMSGIDVEKVWITSDDERVRGEPNYYAPFPHVHLDKQASSIFGAFNNGEEIKYPGDKDASIANIANCRCSQYFRQKARPRPRVSRLLTDFLSDFASGFLLGVQVAGLLKSYEPVEA